MPTLTSLEKKDLLLQLSLQHFKSPNIDLPVDLMAVNDFASTVNADVMTYALSWQVSKLSEVDQTGKTYSIPDCVNTFQEF